MDRYFLAMQANGNSKSIVPLYKIGVRQGVVVLRYKFRVDKLTINP
jgi:hypothetical protein